MDAMQAPVLSRNTLKADKPTQQPHTAGFDPKLWLSALTSIGGGYALMSGRRLAFLVDECEGEALTSVMAQIVGQPERQEAVKSAIERHQRGEVA